MFIIKFPGMSKIFLKIFIAFIILMLSIYLISINFNVKAQRDIEAELDKMTKAKMNFVVKMLESEYENIFSVVGNIFSDEDLNSIAVHNGSPDNFNVIKSINNIRSKIALYENRNRHISNITLHIPSIGKAISSKSVLNTSILEPDTANIEMYNRDRPFINEGGNTYICILTSTGYTRPGNFLIYIGISTNEFINDMSQVFDLQSEKIALLGAENGLSVIPSSIAQYEMTEVVQNQPDAVGAGKIVKREMKINGKAVNAFFKTSDTLKTTLVVYILKSSYLRTTNSYRDSLWIVTILLIVGIVVFSLWINGTVIKPIRILGDAFEKIEKGELDQRIVFRKTDDMGMLYNRFNIMCERLRGVLEQLYEQRIRLQSAELKQLQYQINPHFLYNSLFTLYGLIKMENHSYAMELADYLGRYCMYVTRKADSMVCASDELEHVRNYVSIQFIRFRDNISLEINPLPKECEKLRVPKLIFQPVVENAFKYAFKDQEKQGFFRIRSAIHNGFLIVNFEDNGDKIKEDNLERIRQILKSNDPNIENTGLLNVHRRLQIAFGPESGLNAGISELGGLNVEMSILIKEDA